MIWIPIILVALLALWIEKRLYCKRNGLCQFCIYDESDCSCNEREIWP